MKKLLSLLLVALLALTCVFPVSADLIFEPDDNFYTRHSDECVSVERNFVATETVNSVNEPNSDIIYGKLNKGDEVYISYIYEDSSNTTWGLISFSEVSGWIPMGYLEVIYDNVSFTEEFGSEFNEDTDELKISQEGLSSLVFHDYPGSENFWEFELWDDSYHDIRFTHSYTDPNGATWGYVGYFYGSKGWVCVDAPASTDASVIIERENQSLYPDSLYDDTPEENGGLSPVWIAAILVAAVCAVTAVLILVLTRKKNQE